MRNFSFNQKNFNKIEANFGAYLSYVALKSAKLVNKEKMANKLLKEKQRVILRIKSIFGKKY